MLVYSDKNGLSASRRQGAGKELGDNLYGWKNLIFPKFKNSNFYIVLKTTVLPPRKIIIQVPAQIAHAAGHRDALSLVLCLAPQHPFEVLDKAKTFAANSKLWSARPEKGERAAQEGERLLGITPFGSVFCTQ